MSFTKQLAVDLSCLVKGQLSSAFDKSNFQSLVPIAKAFWRIKLSAEAKQIQSKVKILNHQLFMVKTGQQIHDMVTKQNWRVLPIQYGLPSQSHVLAELIRTAGFEAIQYQSSKGSGKC